MASAFQNRLVGTIILVALAVIFLPEILDGEKRRNTDNFVSFPEPPPMKALVKAETFPIEEVTDAVTRSVEIVDERAVDDPVEESGEYNAASEESAEVVTITVGDDETPEAEESVVLDTGWVVQLGSFRHQKNVRELLNKLEQAGYRAFTRPIQTSSGLLTKVFVGPDLQKNKLDNALLHLQDLTGLKGRVTPFTVE